MIEDFKFIYDTCYCDLTATPDTATVLMGQEEQIDFTVRSTLGDNVFLHTEDPCTDVTTVSRMTSDNTVTVSGMTGTIETRNSN